VLTETGEPGRATGYMEAVREYGSPALSITELHDQLEGIRDRVDGIVAQSLGIQLRPVSATEATDCRKPTGPQPLGFEVPPGGAILKAQVAAPLTLRRFGQRFTVSAGNLEAGTPARLSLPRDSAPDPWYASAPTAVSVCSQVPGGSG
jgi:hypothetical protein